jgi:hypothetical protein
VWLGTVSSGAVKISQRGFVAYAQADGVGPRVQGMLEDDKGRLMVIAGAWQCGWFEGDRLSTRTLTTLGPTRELPDCDLGV